MTNGTDSPGGLMVRKLESIFTLTDEEQQALRDLRIELANVEPDRDIVSLGDRPSQTCLLLDGFTCVYKGSTDGKRQIMALEVPGDIPDLHSLHLEVMDSSIAAISPCKVGFIQHSDLRRVCERYPRIAAAFWRETLVDASIFREWLLNIGRRKTYSRMAHLLCELLFRLRAVGLVESGTFDLPITQVELADLLGTSPVHANRVIQALRADGLIRTQGKAVTVPDLAKLVKAGDFDPLYLHLKENETA